MNPSTGLSTTNQSAAIVTAGSCISNVGCVCIFSPSAEPELIKNAQDRERQSAQHKDNSFDAVVPNDRVCRLRLQDRDQTIDRAARR